MSIYIKSMRIDCFRGIRGLAPENLNHVNIIAGDNNSGKTGILEAMLFLRDPKSFGNVLRVAQIRNRRFNFNSASVYENFISLFPGNAAIPEISISAECEGGRVAFSLIGEKKIILLEPYDLNLHISKGRNRQYLGQYLDRPETDSFNGELKYEILGEKGINSVEFHAHSKTTGREVDKNNFLNMVYLSPVDHIFGNTFNSILRNDSYKETCVNILRLFDPSILDILYLKNEYTGRPVEYIRHSELGNMPLSTYGDGIKKVLALVNGTVKAANGILMIDELETAIHSKYYSDIFRFIIKICKQLQVQLFVTTHSMETIDELLAAQDYDLHDADDVSVITFKKDFESGRTYSRVLSGRHVLSDREEFGFEVRL